MTLQNIHIHIIDNSGVKLIKCINKHKKIIKLGIIIVGVIKKLYFIKQLKKSIIIKILCIGLKKYFYRLNGDLIKYNKNYGILLDNKFNPIGNKIYLILLNEFYEFGFLKISFLVNNLI